MTKRVVIANMSNWENEVIKLNYKVKQSNTKHWEAVLSPGDFIDIGDLPNFVEFSIPPEELYGKVKPFKLENGKYLLSYFDSYVGHPGTSIGPKLIQNKNV